jgi:putative FmdB family regulatory protein
MPTYDYECKVCGHTFEAFQSMSDDPLKECPECGKELRRLIGGGLGIIFKGNGFYATDNKKPSPVGSPSNGNGKSSESKSGSSSSDSGPSKQEGSSTPASTSSDSGSGKKESSASKDKAPAPSKN